MKINKEFAPITITLESPREITVFKDILLDAGDNKFLRDIRRPSERERFAEEIYKKIS